MLLLAFNIKTTQQTSGVFQHFLIYILKIRYEKLMEMAGIRKTLEKVCRSAWGVLFELLASHPMETTLSN